MLRYKCVKFVAFSIERSQAFTLLEVLVVVGTIGMLVSILLPGLSAAREQANGVVCRSNLRQLVLANGYYAEDSNGIYCPGASNFRANLHRWHGTRDRVNQPFDSKRGPLVRYLGPDVEIRQCPSFPVDSIVSYSGGFERGNGGYGYNQAFIGVQRRYYSSGESAVSTDLAGAPMGHVARPGETIMFADAAFAGNGLIEYSFVEPRYHPQYPSYRRDPSIHFRHRKKANVGWCDGHIDSQLRNFSWSSGLYPADPNRLLIGWFGKTDDNSLFDLQ